MEWIYSNSGSGMECRDVWMSKWVKVYEWVNEWGFMDEWMSKGVWMGKLVRVYG